MNPDETLILSGTLAQLAKRTEEVRRNSRLPHYQAAELTEIRIALEKLSAKLKDNS